MTKEISPRTAELRAARAAAVERKFQVARLRQMVRVDKFAKAFPDTRAEVKAKLVAHVAPVVAKAAGNQVALGHIQQAVENAYRSTMLNAQAQFAQATRGPGNRRFRRAAKVPGTEQAEIAAKIQAHMQKETTP